MSPLFYRGQKRQVYCLQLQKEPLLSLRLEPKSSIAKQPIAYMPDYWSPSSSPLSSSGTTVPYAGLIALPPPHCHITFPKAVSRLPLYQPFPGFHTLFLPTGSQCQHAPQCRVQPNKLKSFLMPTSCYASALQKQCQQPLEKAYQRFFLNNSSLALT